MRRPVSVLATLAVIVGGLAAPAQARQAAQAAPETITRDAQGIAHVSAPTLLRALYLNGQVHAQDRLFQMDAPAGLPPARWPSCSARRALDADVQAAHARAAPGGRALLGRGAADSCGTRSPRTPTGSTHCVADHPLPPEYGALQLTAVAPWTPVDTSSIGKLSPSSCPSTSTSRRRCSCMPTSARAARSTGVRPVQPGRHALAPFSDASTVPGRDRPRPRATAQPARRRRPAGRGRPARPRVHEADRRHAAVRAIQPARRARIGSNEWVVAGPTTTTGRPILANDPHLSLDNPSMFYPIALQAPGLDVAGEGFAGVARRDHRRTTATSPGARRRTRWTSPTSTWSRSRPTRPSPSGLATIYQGQLEPIAGDPGDVPGQQRRHASRRRTLGGRHPAGDADRAAPQQRPDRAARPGRRHRAVACSTRASARRTSSTTFLQLDRPREPRPTSARGLKFFDVGSQNWAYADRPRQHRLLHQRARCRCARTCRPARSTACRRTSCATGTGGNEWLPVAHPHAGPGPAVRDPAGGGDAAHRQPAPPASSSTPTTTRPAPRSTTTRSTSCGRAAASTTSTPGTTASGPAGSPRLIRRRCGSGQDRRRRHGTDPGRHRAARRASSSPRGIAHGPRARRGQQRSGSWPALARDPKVVEAVRRLAHVGPLDADRHPARATTRPTCNGALRPPSAREIADSVAATLYAVWRSRFLAGTIDAALGAAARAGRRRSGHRAAAPARHFGRAGVGASGLDFFAAPGVADAEGRQALTLLTARRAGAGPAGGRRTSRRVRRLDGPPTTAGAQLHRLVLDHPLGGPFNAPPAFGALPGAAAGPDRHPGRRRLRHRRRGHARPAGALGATASCSAAGRRGGTSACYRSARSVAAARCRAGRAALPDSPDYLDLLPPYLTDDYYPAYLG